MECAYCTKVAHEGRTVAENELAWAFLTNIPITPGHTLVVPKRCVPDVDSLTDDERLAILSLASEMRERLRKALGAEGFNMAWNEGEMAGQAVPHLHLHIVPRKEGDTGIYEYEPRKFLYRPGSREVSPDAELEAVASLLM